ncbi:MAG: hypothetical protein IJ788_02670 [Oscillospiraceae bacterium]|nr:hypothetical protein [Oscillospiraceae bacterium]
MKTVDIFEQYFEADCVYNGRARHAACVKLTAESDAGSITYEASVSFFPHDAPDDFGISYDAFAAETLCSGKGRRSKKREAELDDKKFDHFAALAESLNGKIYFDKPLIEARRS